MRCTVEHSAPVSACPLAMELRVIGDVQVLLSTLRRWSRQQGVPRPQARRLEIAVAEVAVNAIVHGGGGRCRVEPRTNRVEVVVTDDGGGRAQLGPGLGEGLGVVSRQADGWDVQLLETGGRRVRVWIEGGRGA